MVILLLFSINIFTNNNKCLINNIDYYILNKYLNRISNSHRFMSTDLTNTKNSIFSNKKKQTIKEYKLSKNIIKKVKNIKTLSKKIIIINDLITSNTNMKTISQSRNNINNKNNIK